MKVKALVTHSCPTLCDTMDCMHYSLPGFSVHGILQARILEWVAISFSRGPSRPRDWSWVPCITDRYFTVWALKSYSIPGALLSTLIFLLLIRTTLLMVLVVLIIYSWENQHREMSSFVLFGSQRQRVEELGSGCWSVWFQIPSSPRHCTAICQNREFKYETGEMAKVDKLYDLFQSWRLQD